MNLPNQSRKKGPTHEVEVVVKYTFIAIGEFTKEDAFEACTKSMQLVADKVNAKMPKMEMVE